MSETPTPETDENEAHIDDACEYVNPPEWRWVVTSEFARKLERERDEAMRERDDALKEWDLARDGWGKAIEERDEAREKLASLRKELVRLIRRWKLREKEYLNAVTPAFEMGDKCAGSRYYGESIGTHWAIEDLEILAKRKEEAK